MEINAIRYKVVEDRQTQIGLHMKAEKEDSDRKVHDWRGEVKVDINLNPYCNKFIVMTTEFKYTRDGYLGRISVEKHRINLTQYKIQPIHCVALRVGPREGESEKTELDKMLKWMEGIEPAQMEWAALIVLA